MNTKLERIIEIEKRLLAISEERDLLQRERQLISSEICKIVKYNGDWLANLSGEYYLVECVDGVVTVSSLKTFPHIKDPIKTVDLGDDIALSYPLNDPLNDPYSNPSEFDTRYAGI